MELVVQIIGEDLPAINFGDRGTSENLSRLFIGIQKGNDVVDLVPVTAERAAFTSVFSVSPLPNGRTNFLGPYAHGTRTARFCYLSWLMEGEHGGMSVFSRIKLHLSPLPWARVEAAARAETPIGMRFSLLGKKGGPICASVPEEAIDWEFSEPRKLSELSFPE
ncbi:MAG: DUF5990 family protein [Armatimonadota bacterium]